MTGNGHINYPTLITVRRPNEEADSTPVLSKNLNPLDMIF